MRNVALIAGLAVLSMPVWAGESCEEMKTRIESQVQGHGVKHYAVEIVAKGEAKDAKVVARCERGSKEITYKKL